MGSAIEIRGNFQIPPEFVFDDKDDDETNIRNNLDEKQLSAIEDTMRKENEKAGQGLYLTYLGEAEVKKDARRTIGIRDGAQNTNEHGKSKWVSNFISNRLYPNWFVFVPINLFEQFFLTIDRPFFLMIAVLAAIPVVSVYSPLSTIAAIFFIVCVQMAKDAYEDYSRIQADTKANSANCMRWKQESGKFEKVTWADVEVGDYLNLSRNEACPADLLIITSKTEKDMKGKKETGQVMVDTKQLDGETNMKPRSALFPEISGEPSFDSVTRKLSTLMCDSPLTDEEVIKHAKKTKVRKAIMYPDKDEEWLEKESKTMAASLRKKDADIGTLNGTLTQCNSDEMSVKRENFIVRGEVVRQTYTVYGIVTHTGRDTKVICNERESVPQPKRTRLDKLLYNCMAFCFLLTGGLCLVLCIAMGIWNGLDCGSMWYLQLKESDINSKAGYFNCENPFVIGLLGFFSWLQLMAYIIPIPLAVTIEVLKLFNGKLMDWDTGMYNDEMNQYAMCRNTSVMTDLGQVEIILSDKTGTLTQNKMELIKFLAPCSRPFDKNCGLPQAPPTYEYGAGVTEIAKERARLAGLPAPVVPKKPETFVRGISDAEEAIEDKRFRFYDPRVNGLAFWENDTADEDINEGCPLPAVQHFLLTLCLCHDALVVEETLEDRVFRMMDDDENGAIDRAELQASGLLTEELIGSGAMEVMDADHDDEVTPAEWREFIANKGNEILEKDPSKGQDAIDEFRARIEEAARAAMKKRKNNPNFELPAPEPIYMCSCPEDMALLQAARNLGVILRNVVQDETDPTKKIYTVEVRHKGHPHLILEYELLDIIEFKSFRKRSSVIVGCPTAFNIGPDGERKKIPCPPGYGTEGKVRMYMKGADSFVKERLDPAVQALPITDDLVQGSKRFGGDGLRGLLYSFKDVDREEYTAWSEEWEKDDRKLSNETHTDKMEAGGYPLGVCGLEDALQLNVGDTIRHLAQADIATWILTGDKTDTAIMIGYACCLLATNMELIVIETDEEAADTLAMYDACGDNPRGVKVINALIDKYWEGPECEFEGNGEKQICGPPEGRWKSEWIEGAYSDQRSTSTMNREDFKNEITRNRLRCQIETAQHYFMEGKKYCPKTGKVETGDVWYRLNMGPEGSPNNLWLADISEAGYKQLQKEQGKIEKVQLRNKMSLSVTMTQKEPGNNKSDWFVYAEVDEDSGEPAEEGEDQVTSVEKWLAFSPTNNSSRPDVRDRGQLAMVVEGPALMQLGIGPDDQYAYCLARLGEKCKAVVCCVMQPSWKAQVAEAVKLHMGKVVLCVGDGANDVPMIKAAHVGVGIAGVEGQGAKNASDFAVTQFQHLERIVLIHGRWAYMR